MVQRIAPWSISVVLAIAAIVLLEPSARGTAAEPGRRKPPTAERITRWIADLDSDLYAVRERASGNLAKAGAAALEPLAAAAEEDNLEVATQATRLLFELADTDDSQQMVAVLERISQLENRRVDRAVALAVLDDIHERIAVREVIRFGGEYKPKSNYLFDGRFHEGAVLKIGEAWTGGAQGLEHVGRLKNLKMLSIYATAASDKALDHLSNLTALHRLELYGTKVTPEGVESLRQALPKTQIDYRRGALLGVGGDRTFPGPGAKIGTVQPDSAADRAGILRNDIIMKFNGKPVANFDGLTAFIAKHNPGDKATLEIRRGTTTMTREVTFGRWR